MPIKKLLVAYDGSAGAKEAMRVAIELAAALGGTLAAVWVRSALPHYPETPSEVSEESEAAEAFFTKLGQDVDRFAKDAGIDIAFQMVAGNSAQTILTVAKEEAVHLIVVGNRGHSGLWDRLLGHTADRVSENAHCSVLIVR